MGLHWNVFVAARVPENKLQNTDTKDLISIKGYWYIKNRELKITTDYPGSTVTSPGVIEYLTDNGAMQVEFDTERLQEFAEVCKTKGWILEYWEEFVTDRRTQFRLLKEDL